MLDFISVPLGWILKVCYSFLNNYFLALLLFALIMQIVLLPFSVKQQKNSVRQASLAPKMAAIRKKYAGRTDAVTQQKMQTDMQELYKRENFNPAGGCLPLLIQMPILFALYQVVINPLRYISGMSADQIKALEAFFKAEGIEWNLRSQYIDMMQKVREIVAEGGEMLEKLTEAVTDFAFTDALYPDMSFWGVDLSAVPSITFNPFDWLLLIPVLTVVFHFITQAITKKFTYQSPETVEAQKNPSMRIMNWSMPLLSAWIALSVPAAIGLYWIFRNIIMCVQSILLSLALPAPRFTEEDFKAAEKEMKVGKPRREKSKTPVRSLHRIDDEEYQAEYRRRLAEAEAEAAPEEDEKPVIKEENRHGAEDGTDKSEQ